MNDPKQKRNTAELNCTMTRLNEEILSRSVRFQERTRRFFSDYLISIAIKNAQRGLIKESFPSSASAGFNISRSAPLFNSGSLSTG